MENIKVLSVDTLLKKLRNDLVTTLIEHDDNIKMDGPVITFKCKNRKHTFVQQSNGDWTVITKYDGSLSSRNGSNNWHGQTTYGYTGDYRKKFYMNLMKRLFKDNKIKYAELDSGVYVEKKVLIYDEQSCLLYTSPSPRD